MEQTAIAQATPYVVIANFAMISLILVVFALWITRRELTDGAPGGVQNFGEFVIQFFYNKAKEIGDAEVVRVVAPFLGTFFLLILVSNAWAVLPIPLIGMPPTAFYGTTLGLALCAVGGTFIVSARLSGPVKATKHLVWPNPLQLISEVTDVMSLSLRLFGNIGGEYMTFVLVAAAVPVGIPLILHVLGVIPAFVQALVFTLLTASFVAGAVHREAEREEARAEKDAQESVSAAKAAPVIVEGEAPAQP